MVTLIYEPELAGIPARVKCIACGWMRSDPNFRKEQPSYFPSDVVDKRLGWQMEHPGYDLYFPSSAAAQLGISLELFQRISEKGPQSAADRGPWDDCLQYAGVTEMVGW